MATCGTLSGQIMSALANRPFVKMNGLGNEIVVVDLRQGGVPIDLRLAPAEHVERRFDRDRIRGGGGGRAWMEEKIGKRVNQARVTEALDTGAEVLAAAGPRLLAGSTKRSRGASSPNRKPRLSVTLRGG